MTATARFTRVAIAMALGVTATFMLHVEDAQGAPVVPHVAAIPDSVAVSTPAHRAPRPAAIDTSARRERGHVERAPAAPRRRTPKAKSGATNAPPMSSGGLYVPDQPWETEFFVDNTLPTRHYVFRLASLDRQ